MNDDYQKLLGQLKPYGQEHLLDFWGELGSSQRATLKEQIESVDLGLVQKLFRGEEAPADWSQLARRAEAPPAFRLNEPRAEFSIEQAHQRGEDALAAAQVGVIIVAGGQGTRLGFDHPKGMFPIGPISRAPLFQILFEKVFARSRRHGAPIPLFLMTSPATHDETIDFVEKQQRYGLAREDVRIFCQGTMPAVDSQTGSLLLADKERLFLSPDGHGGMLRALVKSGSLDELHRRGIKHVFYLQVDNPLVSMCDPEFIGYHLLAGSEISTQVVRKRTSRDKVGNVVVIDGQLQILEYSDLNPLPDEIVERRMPDGSPVFWAGNTGGHVFSVDFLTRVSTRGDALPFHIARKAVPHVDRSGGRVEPREPNAIKFERFIFDLLPSARKGIVVEVDEAQAFAPVKNAAGAERDSPETVQAQMITLHRQWLEAAGARLAAGIAVEISPHFAQDAAEVRERLEPGLTVTEPRYFW